MSQATAEPKAEKKGKSTPLSSVPFLDPGQLAKDMAEMSIKVMKGYQILSEMSEDDLAVGTTPRECVLNIDGGKIKLYRYKNDNVTVPVPLLFNFAVVNKEYIADIQPDRSFIRRLMERGHDVYTMDWGYPTRGDRYRTPDDYMDYLREAVDQIRMISGKDKINLMGACQGGTAALIFTALYPEKINTLTTAVMPFEFNLPDSVFSKWAQFVDPDPIADAYGMISGEAMNAGFLMVKPMQRLQKFHAFLQMMGDKKMMSNFLRMEKWLFDSPGQPGEAYRDYTRRVFLNNELSRGVLEVQGRRVNLKNITMPFLAISAQQDHLVPPACTKPVMDHIGSTDKEYAELPGGHVGVFVSGKAQKYVAPFISDWIAKRSQK